MNNKKISISLLLAIALGMTACGGGGDATPELTENNATGDQNLTGDILAPQFTNSDTSFSIIEDGLLVVATVAVSDDSNVTFLLGGDDAQSFELVADTNLSKVLKFKTAPDYETKNSYSVSVVAKDSEGNEATKDLTVTIVDKPFQFDVTGAMGQIEENATDTLILVTKEAKVAPSYTVTGDDSFVVNSNVVTFTAPEYIEDRDNDYRAIITADDDNSEIYLTVTARVYADGSGPTIKRYLLKSEIDEVRNVTTLYTYDSDKYLISVAKSGDSIMNTLVTYEYSNNHTIMKGYKNGTQLESIRVFEDKNTAKQKLVSDLRLSSDEYIFYVSGIADSVAHKDNRHLVKYIYGLENYQTIADLYVYNADDTLSRWLKGGYDDMSPEAIMALSDVKLHTLNAPSGGFPSASNSLSGVQLTSLNSGDMPYKASQESTFTYANGELIGGKLFGYGATTTNPITDAITVEYYSDGALKKVTSEVIGASYDTDRLLTNKGNYQYSYTKDDTKMTVEKTNSTTGADITYIFEEE